MSYRFDPEEMARLMRESRRETQRLFKLVKSEADLRRPPGEGFRPILWHLGHVGAFEGYWILQRVKGERTISPAYDVIFDPIKTPRDDSTNLPPIPEIESYLARVREEVFDFLRSPASNSHPLVRDGYLFHMVLEHEYQHQETLAYLLQMLDTRLKDGSDLKSPVANLKSPDRVGGEMVHVPGGPFELGSRGYPFAYDNEQPPHTVELGDFRIDRYPVTNSEYERFIEARGYDTRSLWSDEGWAWKEENKIEHPLYWSRAHDGSAWVVREMFREIPAPPDHPVTGVSWHEASAYARFVGKRLPTEAEWEKAASWDPETKSKRRFSWGDEPATAGLANFASHNWSTTPVTAYPGGRSAYGCFDMTGNVWEWTSSVFVPYPGFEAYPYREYSELWFDGDHRVLKGGSWVTREPLLRVSFRNFFRPRFRAAFAGFRCAAD
ncbi:MAG TPA: ergothioneine biosynthesis protein EgtB [Blastocatellia bacterium]|nr:ergothioneine biosynthesis protein EgtB [Blastocatellia bacterium]